MKLKEWILRQFGAYTAEELKKNWEDAVDFQNRRNGVWRSVAIDMAKKYDAEHKAYLNLYEEHKALQAELQDTEDQTAVNTYCSKHFAETKTCEKCPLDDPASDLHCANRSPKANHCILQMMESPAECIRIIKAYCDAQWDCDTCDYYDAEHNNCELNTIPCYWGS